VVPAVGGTEMLQGLFGRRTGRGPAARAAKSAGAAAGTLRFRPSLFNLETREVLSSPAVLAPPTAPALVAAPTTQVGQIVPLSITNVAVQNGQLVAQGLLGSTPFSTPWAWRRGPMPLTRPARSST